MAAFATGLDEALGVGVVSASCVNLIRTVGEENVKFFAERVNQPFFSFSSVVET